MFASASPCRQGSGGPPGRARVARRKLRDCRWLWRGSEVDSRRRGGGATEAFVVESHGEREVRRARGEAAAEEGLAPGAWRRRRGRGLGEPDEGALGVRD